MAEGDKIEYKDLISPDDSILEVLIQLEQLNKSYSAMINAIRAGAKEIVHGMKQISGATSEGKAKIDDAIAATSRLEKAEKELEFALSETGKKVAWVKAQTQDANKVSVEQARQLKAVASSYDKMALELEENIRLYKSLSAEERQSAEMGGLVLSTIIELSTQIRDLDKALKPAVQSISKLEKAERELAYLQSEEGQKLLEIKKQIREITSGRKEEKQEVDRVAQAYEKLQKAKSEENLKIHEYNQQAAKANAIKKLEAQLNNAAVGSYDQLSAQYQLNKIALNAMSAEERNATEAGKELEQQTLRIYKQMIHLQEATGNHRLSVGNYAKAWNGLGMAVNQIVREIPAATMGLNMFFLAISNNVPILLDEIQRVKEKNAMLRAEGRPTENVMRTIVSALVSWQTALILGVTVLSMHGGAIVEWIKKLARGPKYVLTLTERLKNLNKELEKTNGSYGQNVITVKKLQSEWKKLANQKEQKQWLRDNEAEFKKLDISINDVNDAEKAFEKFTPQLITALKHRAKAAAATKLAADKYEEALRKQHEAEVLQKRLDEEGPSVADRFRARLYGRTKAVQGAEGTPGAVVTDVEGSVKDRINALYEERKAAEKTADAYFDMAESSENMANAVLKAVGLDKYHRPGKKGGEPRDLTDTINRNDITLQKKYEESVTKLLRDEYIKRRKALFDATMTENSQLEEKYRKNVEYINNVDGKYKQLTDEQKQQIAQQQKWITDTIANNLEQLNYDIEQLENERKVNSLKILRETIDWELSEIEKSIEDEKALKLEQLKQEENLVKKTNATVEEGGRSEAEITAEYQKKRLQIIAEYDKLILGLRQKSIEDQLEIVKKGSQEEIELLLKQNEIARQQAITENRAKPAAEQQDEGLINRVYGVKAERIKGGFTMTGLEETQELQEAQFNLTMHSEQQTTKFKLLQEKERWEQQIKLAKTGGLQWSDTQIKAAEATVEGINKEIDKLSGIEGVIANIGEYGLTGGLLASLGFDDEAIGAVEEATNVVLDSLQSIFEAEVELAEMEVEKAKERVDAAKSAYQSEIEARNNGYANNVATAKKELQLEKRNQLEKEKLLEDAQKRQEAINSIVQASSLVTASANIWSSLSAIPIVGPALAIAMITTMWGSFAAAKIKAAQVTRASSQEYGEGGLEFLEGGSHASGNDIDLATKNSKGKNMRAEGGEALAIINKRSTRRYRKQLPGIIESLNKGTFEAKYLKAFEAGDVLQSQIFNNSTHIDLSKIERDVTEIKKQNAIRYYNLNDGSVVEIRGNVKRYIRG